MTTSRELLFRHRGTLLALAAAPVAVGCIELGTSWPDYAIGLALLALGALLRLFSVRRIGKRARVFTSGAMHLLCEGPYAHVRNPLYLANVLTAAGACVLAGLGFYSLIGIALVVGVYQLVVPVEEKTLGELFGESYELYRQRVPRWLPRITAAAPVDDLDPLPLWSWSEVLVREAPYLVGVFGIGAGFLYMKLGGPGVAPATSALGDAAARIDMPRWALIVVVTFAVAAIEGASTFLKKRRHALRKAALAASLAESRTVS